VIPELINYIEKQTAALAAGTWETDKLVSGVKFANDRHSYVRLMVAHTLPVPRKTALLLPDRFPDRFWHRGVCEVCRLD